MVRKCECSGGCCGPQGDEVNRRDFLAIVGAGATTAALSGPAWADWLQKQASPEELDRYEFPAADEKTVAKLLGL